MVRPDVYETGYMLTLLDWLQMAQKKHAWPDEADGTPQAYGVLSGEMRELRYAVDHCHPDEHIIAELLDVITVATRMLLGEHLRDEVDRYNWVKQVLKAKPTMPGEIGPYDEKRKEKKSA